MFKKVSLVLASAIVATTAHAALPAGVDTSITAAGADGVALVGLLAAAGAAVFLIHKVLSKFGISL